MEPHREKRVIQVLIVVVMSLAYGFAVLYEGSLVALLLSAYGAIVQFAPVLVATLYWRRAHAGSVFGGVVLGSVVTVAMTLSPDLRPWAIHAGAYGLAANSAVVVLGSWLWGESNERSQAYLAVAEGP